MSRALVWTWWMLAFAAFLSLLYLAGEYRDRPQAGIAIAAPCDYDHELTRTVEQLGDDLDNWHVTSFTNGYYGFVRFSEGYARMHPEMPCDAVADTAKHEWMHLQQVRFHGDREAVYDRYGERKHFERVASCGALLLGSDRLSYLDPAHPMYSGPCSDEDWAEARRLINWRPS